MQDIACVVITLFVSVTIMIEQKKDAQGNPPYWVCTNCKWAFQALQEANEHGRRCGRDEPAPTYRHYEREIT